MRDGNEEHRHHRFGEYGYKDGVDSSNSRHSQRKANAEFVSNATPPDDRIKIALSLHKVQQSIYLLDFQRLEVIIRHIFEYM